MIIDITISKFLNCPSAQKKKDDGQKFSKQATKIRRTAHQQDVEDVDGQEDALGELDGGAGVG